MPRDRGRRIAVTYIAVNKSRMEMCLQDGSVIIAGGDLVYDHQGLSGQLVFDMASVYVVPGGGTFSINHDPAAYEQAKARKVDNV